MPYTLIISEKPSAAQRIAQALAEGKVEKVGKATYYFKFKRGGKDMIVVPAVGHLFVLDEKNKKAKWTYPVFDVEWRPTFADKNSQWAEKYYEAIAKLAKGASEYVSACDYDIEGCTPNFEKILLKNGTSTKLTEMGNLVDDVLSRETKCTWNGFEYATPSENLLVPCMNPETSMIEFRKIRKVMRRKSDSRILRITTETGRKIHVSKNHPMFILTAGGMEIRKAGFLNTGEFIPVAKELPFTESSMTGIDLIEEISKRGRVDEYYVYGARNLVGMMPAEIARLLEVNRKTALGWRFWDRMPLWAYMKLESDVRNRKFLRIGPAKAKTRIPVLIPLDRDLGRLVGYYLAEGCTDTGDFIGIYFGPHETGYADELESIFLRLLGIRPKKRFRKGMKGTYGRGNGWEIGTKSRILNFIFSEVLNLGHNAHTKKLPDFIFSTPLEFYKNVIDAYLAGDGSLYKTERGRLVVSATSKSRDLIEAIHLVLLKMGIISNMVHDRKRNIHFLYIGIKKQLRKIVAYGMDTMIKTPEMKEELLRIGQLEDKRDVFNYLPNFMLSGCKADSQTMRNMNYSQRTSVASLIETTPIIEKIFNSNLHFLRISAIEEIEYDSPYLYDIETETGSFMHGNAVITHNSTIAFNIIRFICGAKDGRRMKFSTLTDEDIVEAFKNASPHLDFPQIEAGLTRHTLDFMWGINMSRALTLALEKANGYWTLSIGRVQGPTLKILEDREREIESFVSELFWTLEMHGAVKGNRIIAFHATDRFWEKEQAAEVFSRCSGKKAMVESLEKKMVKQLPPTPFDLTTLQREAFNCFGYSPKMTLDVAQTLYEQALISYPRTSSQKLPQKLGLKAIIGKLAGQSAYAAVCSKLAKKNELVPREGEKEDMAHPSIFPTGQAPSKLNGYQHNIYDLVVRRFLSTFGNPAIRERITVVIDSNGEKFKSFGVRTIKPEWMEFYGRFAKFKEQLLPAMEKGDVVDKPDIKMNEKQTTPPDRFSQASILKNMEDRNLGTKATRAQILQTLYDRDYIKDKSIRVTPLGSAVIESLEKHCPEIISEDLTKTLDAEIELIQKGKKKREDIIAHAQKDLEAVLGKFKEHELHIGNELKEGVKEFQEIAHYVGVCPACGGELRIIRSHMTKKYFVGCSGYPKCRQSYPLPQKGQVVASDEKCEKCGLNIVLIRQFKRRPWKLCVKDGFVGMKFDKKKGEKDAKSGEKGKEANKAAVTVKEDKYVTSKPKTIPDPEITKKVQPKEKK